MNIFSKISAAITLLLLFTTVGSNAASVESEVSDTDTVVIGAASEKVTLRVTGYKNLEGSARILGTYSASTSSTMGRLVLNFSPEHTPSQQTASLKGVIKNEAGDEVEIITSAHAILNINGKPWLTSHPTEGDKLNGSLTSFSSGRINPGVYSIGMRAALYQQ